MYNYLQALMGLPLIISVILKITVILGLGWIGHLLLAGYNPRWRVLLWRCVIVGIFLIPALIPLKYLQIRIPKPSSEPTQVTTSTLPFESQLTFTTQEIPPELVIDSEPVEVEYNSYSHSPHEASFSLSKWLRENIWLVIFSTWAIVTAIFALRLLTGFFLIKKKVKVSSTAPEHIKHLLDQVADDLDCPVNVNLNYLPEVMTPFLFGYRKPVIIIPQQMITNNNSSELQAVFAHELIHLRSQDMFWIFITKLVGILLWFNPLVWKLRDAHNAACEEVCDAVAADYVGSAERYSSALARIVLNIVGKTKIVGGIPMAHSSNILKRIRLLKRKVYSSPLAKRSTILSVLLLMTVFVCVGGVKLTYANSNQQNERVIHFPEDYSIGTVIFGELIPGYDGNLYGVYLSDEISWDRSNELPAQGQVTIPAGKLVQLSLNPRTCENPQNLSVLQQFQPDDFYSLSFSFDLLPILRSVSETGSGDECMPYITHLTGLKSLELGSSNITARGLEYLSEFESLERLSLPVNITDDGMVHVEKVTTLRVLSIGNMLTLGSIPSQDNITNAGLSRISNLKALESLYLNSNSITDEGLQVLSELPNLRQLIINGNFTGDAIAYLQDVPSLKYLWVSFPMFDDQGMEHVANITQLEGLHVQNIEGGDVTDEGAEYIKDMPNLTFLDLASVQLTDRALIALKEISTLESLELSSTGFTDEGIKNLTELKNLKRLYVGNVRNFDELELTDESLHYIGTLENLEELTLGGTGFTDEGMRDLAKLTNLTQLSFFGGPNLTDEGMQNLAELKQLKTLLLHGNHNLTNKSFEALSELKNLTSIFFFGAGTIYYTELNMNINDDALKHLSNLTSLEDILIYNCHSFTDAGLQHLEGLTLLRRTMFFGTDVTPEGMARLQEKIPGLTLISPSGGTARGVMIQR